MTGSNVRVDNRLLYAMDVQFLRLSPNVPLPEYKTSGACAFDVAVIEGATLAPGERKKLRTGLVVCVPPGYVLILEPRSSNAKKGVRIANGTGVIDQDYCGPTDELFAFVHNFGQEPYTVEAGERLMQGLIVPILRPNLVEVTSLHAPNRGGFGTTGK